MMSNTPQDDIEMVVHRKKSLKQSYLNLICDVYISKGVHLHISLR